MKKNNGQSQEPEPILCSDSPAPNAGGVYRVGKIYHWAPSAEAHPSEWRELTLAEALTTCAEIHAKSAEYSTQDLSHLLTDAANRLNEVHPSGFEASTEPVFPMSTTGKETDLESLRDNVRTDADILLRYTRAIQDVSWLAVERCGLDGAEKEVGESLRLGAEALVAITADQIRFLRRATVSKGGHR